MASNDTFGLRRNVDKQIDLTIDEYIGNARPGELLVDLNPQGYLANAQYTVYVGLANGGLQPVGGGGGGGGSGTVTSISTAGSGLGFTLSGGPIFTAGTVTLGVPSASALRVSLGDGNVSNVIRGDGTLGSAPSSGSIANGTSGISIPISGGNVITTVGGTTIMTVTTTGVNVAGSSNVTGTSNVGGNLNVSGNTNITNNLAVGGNISGTNLTLTGNSTVAGNSVVTGNITGGNLITSGNISGNNLTLTGNSTTAGSSTVTGNSSVGGNLSVGGNVAITGNVTTPIVANASIPSTSTSTGTIILSGTGGIGLGGNIHVGGNANVTGNLYALGNSILGSNANVFISGGAAGQVLSTVAGTGALQWVSPFPVSIPELEWSALSDGTGQVFTNAQLAYYNSLTSAITVFKDGVKLSNAAGDYTLTGTSLTINTWIGTGSIISVGAGYRLV